MEVGKGTKEKGDDEMTTEEGKDEGARADKGGVANKSPENKIKSIRTIGLTPVNFWWYPRGSIQPGKERQIIQREDNIRRKV